MNTTAPARPRRLRAALAALALAAAALLTLGELRDTQVDMFTTVFVGNSQTKVIGGKMVTPRGYLQRGE